MNVLILSLSRKVPLVEAFRNAQRWLQGKYGLGKIWGADADPNCVGRHFVDDFWESPRLTNIKPEVFLAECLKREIKLIVPTSDEAMTWFSYHGKQFDDAGIFVPRPSGPGIYWCRDKAVFDQQCGLYAIPSIRTYTCAKKAAAGLCENLVVKEREGSGSRGMAIGLAPFSAEQHGKKLKRPIYQPVIDGTEYSVDFYVNQQKEVVEVVPRLRSKVRDGESEVTETVDHPELVRLTRMVADKFFIRGHAVLQAFETKTGQIKVIECNPRVGGASNLAFMAGCESPRYMMQEAMGEYVKPTFGEYKRGLRLIRYAADRYEMVDAAGSGAIPVAA